MMSSRGRAAEHHQRVAAVAVPKRRFDEGPPTSTAAATPAGWRCRSCAGVAIADCVALGCCPCALVSLLALALVRAPLLVGRRCLGRLRTRRRLLLQKKRVRDVAAADARGKAAGPPPVPAAAAEAQRAGGTTTTTTPGAAAAAEAELAWLEEMYRAGHWGFGRVSSSRTTP